MPIVPAGYAQVNYVLTLEGDSEEMIVTMGIKFDEVLTAEYQDIVNDVDFVFFDAFKDNVSSLYTFQRAVLYAAVEGGAAVFESNVGPRDFLFVETPAPQNVAFLIKKITGAGGRTGRGRFYLPGVPQSAVNGAGVLAGGAQTNLQDSANDFLTDLTAVSGVDVPVLLHTLVGDIPNEISALAVDNRVATQRRRLR